MKIMSSGVTPALALVFSVVLTTAVHTQFAYASGTIAAAARSGDLDQSRELINAGADVNLPEPDGTTPLLWAVYKSAPELVKILLDAGADPNLANKLDINPLLQASRYGDAGMISALLAKGASFTNTKPGVESPLMAAARSGSVEAVKVLLKAGANPNASELLENQTAMMWAAAEGHLEVVRVLLDAGANPNLQARVSELTKRANADFPSGGFAALHWAARNGDEPLIRLLLNKGADINVRNGDSSTPMMLAIVNDRFDIAKLLLELGADPNDGSLYYITEMRDATTDWRARDGTVFRADHPNKLSALDLTQALLVAGADPNLPFSGQMHNASMCCDTKADATPFYRAAVAADVEGLKLMLAHGADTEWKPALPEPKKVEGVEGEEEEEMPMAMGNQGKSALMVAITGGKGVGVAGGPNDLRYGLPEFRETANRKPFDAVKVLLEAGANVNVADPKGATALHIAANTGELNIVRALVAKGAELNAKNMDDQTPLEFVRKAEPRKATPGFFFQEPEAKQDEIIAALEQMAAMSGDNTQ